MYVCIIGKVISTFFGFCGDGEVNNEGARDEDEEHEEHEGDGRINTSHREDAVDVTQATRVTQKRVWSASARSSYSMKIFSVAFAFPKKLHLLSQQQDTHSI